MKKAIIYKSVHHGNTKKIAEAMAKAIRADLIDLEDANRDTVENYDLIGFGSGIFFYKPHKDLRKYVEGLDLVENKKAFVFYTSGNGKSYSWLNKNLSRIGFDVIGEFTCKGYDTYGPFKLIGGHNKGRPDMDDIKNAEEFAMGLSEM